MTPRRHPETMIGHQNALVDSISGRAYAAKMSRVFLPRAQRSVLVSEHWEGGEQKSHQEGKPREKLRLPVGIQDPGGCDRRRETRHKH